MTWALIACHNQSWCFRFCTWECLVANHKWWETTADCYSFMEVWSWWNNYHFHDEDLSAIVHSFQHWCHLLEGSPIKLFTMIKESYIFPKRLSLELKTNSLGVVSYLFWLHDRVLQMKTTRKGRCSIVVLLHSPTSRRANILP